MRSAVKMAGEAARVYSLDEFLAKRFPPRPWLVEGLMQARDLLMVHARRGVGKTHFVLALARALAAGEPFLQWAIPRPCGVLLVDGEMPREDLATATTRERRSGRERAYVATENSVGGLPREVVSEPCHQQRPSLGRGSA